jgi:hypothetical protein
MKPPIRAKLWTIDSNGIPRIPVNCKRNYPPLGVSATTWAAGTKSSQAARRWRLRTRVWSPSSANSSDSLSSMTPPNCSASTMVTARR